MLLLWSTLLLLLFFFFSPSSNVGGFCFLVHLCLIFWFGAATNFNLQWRYDYVLDHCIFWALFYLLYSCQESSYSFWVFLFSSLQVYEKVWLLFNCNLSHLVSVCMQIFVRELVLNAQIFFVYVIDDQGAEVVRMYKTLLGSQGFRKVRFSIYISA